MNLHAREQADAHLAGRQAVHGPRGAAAAAHSLRGGTFPFKTRSWTDSSRLDAVMNIHAVFLVTAFFLIKISSDPTCEFHTDQGYSSGTIRSQTRAYFNVWGFVF